MYLEKLWRNLQAKLKQVHLHKEGAEVKPRKISQDALKQMGLDDREYFNPKSGKTFINTQHFGDRFKKNRCHIMTFILKNLS